MKDDFIFGLRPVLEAIEAGKTIDKIFVQNALQGEIYAELKAILAKNKIPRIILITGHRRENFGLGFEEICHALSVVANENPDIQIIYPVHLNPIVREPVKRILSNLKIVNMVL